MAVELTSSSNVVGERDGILTIVADPQTMLTGAGYIILTVPEYYPDAGGDYMVSDEDPRPCTCTRG